jgi:hypothetical protein
MIVSSGPERMSDNYVDRSHMLAGRVKEDVVRYFVEARWRRFGT